MRRTAVVAGVVVVFVAGLIAGCGGSSDDDALSKSEFVAKANAICKQGNAKIDAAGQDLGDQPTQQEISDFAEQTLLPAVQSEVDQIKELKPPSDDQDQVDAILAAADDGLAKLKADPSSVADDSSDPFAEANKLAGDYGMTECAG